jgi:hypothetical protein
VSARRSLAAAWRFAHRAPALLAAFPIAALLLIACGGAASPADTSPGPPAQTASTRPLGTPPISDTTASTPASLRNWPEFGLNPQRGDATNANPGIGRADLAHLRRRRIALPGTVDSSPIYLHAVTVAGAVHDAIVLTTTYGKALALDASSGAILWTFTPRDYARLAGTEQITTASPIADPDRRFVYSASPDGQIHKLALVNGAEDSGGSWPVSITRDPTHEKLAAALNIDGPDVVAATGGYLGDAPPYQGHVVLIDRASGALRAVFNTVCSNRRGLIVPSSCSSSDSAILSRSGPVIEPGGRRILIDTGNGPWNGTSDFGDSLVELTFPGLRLRQSYTPVNQRELNENDTDLGSSAPALLGHNRIVLAGKDGIMRVLALSRLDGHPPSSHHAELGGEVQQLQIPGGGELFTAPAVWRRGGRITMFVADEGGTGAYALHGGRLRALWVNHTPGTSPVLAGALLYVYDPQAGGIDVYDPGSSSPIAKLPGTPGHWNSPIVVDGHVVEPEGDANDHRTSGTLDLFSVG